MANFGHTWYDHCGTGESLVLLHPGMADARVFAANLDGLATRFRVFTPDRRGHGRTPDLEGPITYEVMAQDTIGFLTEIVGGPAHLVGSSDGAIVALLAALRRPDLVRKVAIVSGVFHRAGWAAETAEVDAAATAFFTKSYGEVSPDGAEHFPKVAAKLARMHAAEPALTAGDLAGVTSRALVMVGDDDEVTLEHAAEMYRALPDAELAVVPGTSHGLLVEKPRLCNEIIIDFLGNDPVQTYAPIRRATGE